MEGESAERRLPFDPLNFERVFRKDFFEKDVPDQTSLVSCRCEWNGNGSDSTANFGEHMKKSVLALALFCASFAFVDSTSVVAVARTIWAEASSEGSVGMRLVASVIYNRANGEPCNLYATVTRRKQFSCWNGGMPIVRIRNEKDKAVWDECVAMAKSMDDGTFVPTTTATHYHTTSVNPRWSAKMKLLRTYKRHRFYK